MSLNPELSKSGCSFNNLFNPLALKSLLNPIFKTGLNNNWIMGGLTQDISKSVLLRAA